MFKYDTHILRMREIDADSIRKYSLFLLRSIPYALFNHDQFFFWVPAWVFHTQENASWEFFPFGWFFREREEKRYRKISKKR